MWGLTHVGQQMSRSLRLGQMISMTKACPDPHPKTSRLYWGPCFSVGELKPWFTGDVDFCEELQLMIVKLYHERRTTCTGDVHAKCRHCTGNCIEIQNAS